MALGNIAYERFQEARDAGAPKQELLRRLNDAAAAYQRALGLLPEDAVQSLAVAHNQLAIIHGEAKKPEAALAHYQKAIRYDELRGDRYGAGQTRLNVALLLAGGGRLDDSLLYAQTALHDFKQVGDGAKSRRHSDSLLRSNRHWPFSSASPHDDLQLA